MKKLTSLVLALTLLFALAACGKDEHAHDEAGHTHEAAQQGDAVHSHDPSGPPVTSVEKIETGLNEYYNADEDAAYHELFFDKKTSEYENKKFTKYGTFAVIYDAYNEVERYYVWGYGHESKDCCFQWEFVKPENAELPIPGSYIKVEGTMTADEKALDGYWLTNASVSVEEEFAATEYDYDFVTLSPTLMRVQITNMLQKPEQFADKSVRIFGRTLSENTLTSAYADDNWSVHFSASRDHLNADTIVMIEGTFNQGGASSIITSSSITAEN